MNWLRRIFSDGNTRYLLAQQLADVSRERDEWRDRYEAAMIANRALKRIVAPVADSPAQARWVN